MTLKQREDAFVKLGGFLTRHFEGNRIAKEERFHEDLDKLVYTAFTYNGWFTQDNVESALKGIALMLNAGDVQRFCSQVQEPVAARKVAVIMAGNIPAVGFHDLLSVLASGHSILIKASSDDHVLIPFLAGMLIYFEPAFAPFIEFAGARLEQFDAVIATGSNNSSRYFDYYFGKYPHIIRKNRTSVAVLDGNESEEELAKLGKDVFQYFGLGCRNVTKLFVPAGYDFARFFEAIYPYKEVVNNKKYGNNYDYNRAIYLLDGVAFLDNNFLMLREQTEMHPPAASLFYEFYTDLADVTATLDAQRDNIQCLVGKHNATGLKALPFGQTQEPTVFDYADGVDTIAFLNSLS